ncbi:hypothetical protein PV458_09470 [Streptomyces sp. MN03-5084-2B]|nr:hypothetical protein [Streptomyces sp. MN03-5084-2B]
MAAVAEQVTRTRVAFERVERLERIADALAARHDPSAAELRDVVDDLVDDVEPVRVAAAAEVLKVSKMTITSWLRRGIFKRAAAEANVVVLDPHRLHAVLHILEELRRAGIKPGNFAEQLWHRLEDGELAESDFFLRGLEDYRAGRVQKA